jgi:hypothetical protein
MDDIALYGRSLSELEIQAIFNSGLFGVPLDQVAPVLTVSPRIFIGKNGPDEVTVFWDSTFEGFTLQSTTDLANPDWMDVPGVMNNSVTLTGITGNAFFRLVKPQP